MESKTTIDKLAPVRRDSLPDGWQLVPKTPTEEMLRAGMNVGYICSIEEYDAMLAAAPSPPSEK
ncbi:MAG: hypothetical protein KGI37_07540 [Alphaproteobacteria bacterium]|nr:hypothetical protein [Alphaproteobacteria bacterium]